MRLRYASGVARREVAGSANVAEGVTGSPQKLRHRQGLSVERHRDTVAEHDLPVPLNGAYVGTATIVGYTVVFQRGQVSHGVAICDTPAGERTVARGDDAVLLDDTMQREFVGCVVVIAPEGTFALSARHDEAGPT